MYVYNLRVYRYTLLKCTCIHFESVKVYTMVYGCIGVLTMTDYHVHTSITMVSNKIFKPESRMCLVLFHVHHNLSSIHISLISTIHIVYFSNTHLTNLTTDTVYSSNTHLTNLNTHIVYFSNTQLTHLNLNTHIL